MSQRRKFTDYEKKTVYADGNGRCAICGKPIRFCDMTIDHIIPLSRGGTNAPDNLQLSCRECNFMKSALTMAEFRAKVAEIYKRSHTRRIYNIFSYGK